MWEHANTLAIIGSFVLTALGMMIAGGIKLGRVVVDLKDAISAVKLEIEERVTQAERNYGETISALRQKIHEVEMWSRDNFVRRDGFYKVRDDLKNDIREMGVELKADIKEVANEVKALRDARS